MMSELWRLFVAIELPDDTLRAIERVQTTLQRRAPERALRWVRPEGIHLTLKFLGDVPRSQIPAMEAALAEAAAGHDPLSLSIEELGGFPNPQRPRVLWLGVTGDTAPLARLQADVEKHLAPLGYPRENRPFSPHLTLARVRREASREDVDAVGALTRAGWEGVVSQWEAGAVSLMRSQLKPSGAVYTRVADLALSG